MFCGEADMASLGGADIVAASWMAVQRVKSVELIDALSRRLGGVKTAKGRLPYMHGG